MSNLDHRYLFELKEKIERQNASSEEKREYIKILYENGSLSENLYGKYLDGQYTDEIINGAVTIGSIIIGNKLMTEFFKKIAARIS